ncbi:MAG: protein kinase [Betaproteobacteria bacterium]|nr:MAG: protein kinase [Betaproteobacteria bacterium]
MPSKIGKYEVKGLLGRGGMGVVYKCYDEAIDRHVAIKAITKADLDPEDLKHAIQRFRHEAKAVGRLLHPAIVQIYDYAEDDELAYIVMELVNGRTLLEHLKAGDTYDLKQAGWIVRQVLEGMGHAHAQGVIHRDIKPSNIMLTEDSAVKIADFGIARTESSSLTQVGDIIGTLYYMAPEQFLGGKVTPATDVYSIGVIAYEILVGRRPFSGNNARVMQKVLNEVPENPSMINLDLTPAVDRMLQRALAKKPIDRFQSAEEFALELHEVVLGDIATDSGKGRSGSGRGSALKVAAPVRPRPEIASPAVSNEPPTEPGGSPGMAVIQAASMLNVGAAKPGASHSVPASATESASRHTPQRAKAWTPGPVPPRAADSVPPVAELKKSNSSASSLTSLSSSSIDLDQSVRKARVLFVDDEERILKALKALFRDRYHVFATTDCEKALHFLGKYAMNVVVSDQRMPEMLGVEFLRRAREISPNAVRILLTGYSDLAAIVGSINDGEVYRFISKPWDNAELKTIIGEAVTIGLELSNTKSVDAELPAKVDASVMVIDQNEDMYRVVTEIVGKTCPVVYAENVQAAVDRMQESEIAVVITDVDFAQDQLTSMLKLLKQENPQILTIVVTSASDSEMVIELINEAQVFRFLNKPVNVNLMRTHLQAALKRYMAFRDMPALTKAEKVEVVEQIRDSDFGQTVVKKMGGARDRWRARAAAAARRRAATA